MIRLARAGRRDELRGGDTAASTALLGKLRRAPQPFPGVPVTVLSAARGFPRRLRAHWTVLQAGLAASAPRGRHIVIPGSGHGIHQARPDAGADAILQIIAEIRAPLCYAARTGWDPRHEDVGARPITWNTSKGRLAWLRRLAYLPGLAAEARLPALHPRLARAASGSTLCRPGECAGTEPDRTPRRAGIRTQAASARSRPSALDS